MIDILLKQTYNEYFKEMNNKVNAKLKSILDSKDTESLEFYYGKETINSSLQNMMEEIVNNPEKY
jgi:succinate dehydrogenase flavin-adding protein (antitoxin of CptAB toxin-antitoxin module)